VAFWNLSNRDLRIKIAGQAQVIARGKNLTLDLSRQFVWQVEGQEPQTENMPATESAMEIVLRY